MGNELGYGNQLFVLVEGREGSDEATDQIEEMADRLTSDMEKSGLFKYARCGLKEEELLNIVRLFAWNFPFFLQPDQWEAAKHKLDPREIRQTVGATGSELVTPFSAMGTNYFVDDPLGLMEVVARGGRGLSQFGNFDLTWGSGNRFFSQDHKALLIIAEPRLPAVDYQFAQRVVQWTRQHIAAIGAEPSFRHSGVRAMPAGAYVYAEEDHKFIEKNIRRISLISIVGNLLLCLADLSPHSPAVVVAVARQPGHSMDHGRRQLLPRRSEPDQPVFHRDPGGPWGRSGRTFLQSRAAGMGQDRESGYGHDSAPTKPPASASSSAS